MAKYSKATQEKVGEVMHERKEGTLKSGSGKKVTSRKQAIAIALSEAHEEGEKVSSKQGAHKKTAHKKAATKKHNKPKNTRDHDSRKKEISKRA